MNSETHECHAKLTHDIHSTNLQSQNVLHSYDVRAIGFAPGLQPNLQVFLATCSNYFSEISRHGNIC
jgi:hypothetical protein